MITELIIEKEYVLLNSVFDNFLYRINFRLSNPFAYKERMV